MLWLSFPCLAVLTEHASSATFAPTPEEFAAANPDVARQWRRGDLVAQADEIGRRFYEVDDMRYSADEAAVDGAFLGNRWRDGIVYYTFAADIDYSLRELWRLAAGDWSREVSGISFVEGTGTGNYIFVQKSTGNNSYVGMIGGSQIMNIADWMRSIVAHEIGHALGLEHEQSRSDRNSYVTILFDNITPGFEDNFEIAYGSVTYSGYDFDSIMHYHRLAFSRNGGNTVEPLPHYSSYLNTIGTAPAPSYYDLAGMRDRYPVVMPLATALDTVLFNWTTSFTARWLGQSAVTHDGVDAAATPQLTNWGQSSVETNITGPGVVTFWWKVSSQAGSDFLRFDLNNQYLDSVPGISGESGWQQRSVSLPPGPNTLRWTYSKDGAGVGGADTAWLDEVTFQVGRKADFNANNYSDFIWQNTRTGERVMWFLGHNAHYQGGQHLQTIAPEWRIAGTGDLNADGHADFTWQNIVTGEHVVWFLRNGQYQSGFYFDTIPPEWQIASSADLNGDEHADFVWQNTRTGEHVVWFLRNGRFQSGFYFDTIPPEWQIGAAADLNGDRHADLVWQNTRTGEHVTWFMRNGRFQSGFYFQTFSPDWRLAGAANFNSDQHADFVWQNIVTGERVIWFLNNGQYQTGLPLQTIDREWDLCVR
ncbi:MAG TPA: M12 family metallopeptidase [Chthoniobacterales bacterium]